MMTPPLCCVVDIDRGKSGRFRENWPLGNHASALMDLELPHSLFFFLIFHKETKPKNSKLESEKLEKKVGKKKRDRSKCWKISRIYHHNIRGKMSINQVRLTITLQNTSFNSHTSLHHPFLCGN